MQDTPSTHPSENNPSLSHWRDLIEQFDAPTGIDDYELTLEAITERFELHGPESFDFSGIDSASCSIEHLAAALRFTCNQQTHIPTWREGLLRCIDACALHGMDARELLMGLL